MLRTPSPITVIFLLALGNFAAASEIVAATLKMSRGEVVDNARDSVKLSPALLRQGLGTKEEADLIAVVRRKISRFGTEILPESAELTDHESFQRLFVPLVIEYGDSSYLDLLASEYITRIAFELELLAVRRPRSESAALESSRPVDQLLASIQRAGVLSEKPERAESFGGWLAARHRLSGCFVDLDLDVLLDVELDEREIVTLTRSLQLVPIDTGEESSRKVDVAPKKGAYVTMTVEQSVSKHVDDFIIDHCPLVQASVARGQTSVKLRDLQSQLRQRILTIRASLSPNESFR